jgi:hypothetical protein
MKHKFSKLSKVLIMVIIMMSIVIVFLYTKKADAPIVTNDGKIIEPVKSINDEVLGNKDDLLAFSIAPGTKVKGVVSYRGVIKNTYFFEANILINILDLNKKVLKASNAVAKGEWMTSGPVNFEGNIDFTLLPKGQAYFEIHNDNASGLKENDKSILIPIIIE